jgi:hypothetical protein
MWHYSPDGIQRLEVSEAMLAGLARSGQLTADMLVWQPGMDAWRPAREVRSDLFSEGYASATPPPRPPAETVPTLWVGGTASGQPSFHPAPTQPHSHTFRRPAGSAALTSVISGTIAAASAITNFCCCAGIVITPVAGLIAIIFGHIAHAAAKNQPAAEQDQRLAIVGLVLGYMSLILLLGYTVYIVAMFGLAGMGVMAEEIRSGEWIPE